jgi:hypothetical protein
MVRTIVLGLTILLGAAQAPTLPTWPIDDAPDEFGAAIDRAKLIVIELQGALLEELNRTLQSRGETAALRSCHLDAINVTQRIGRTSGIAVGRTSDRLRSPTNVAPAWAAPIVARHAGASFVDVQGYVVDLGGGRIGVLQPIRMARMCLGCHGAQDRLSKGVRGELAERYPADHAVGFRDGDLRGWFWMEMPPAAK